MSYSEQKKIDIIKKIDFKVSSSLFRLIAPIPEAFSDRIGMLRQILARNLNIPSIFSSIYQLNFLKYSSHLFTTSLVLC